MSQRKKILILGSTGQIGHELVGALNAFGEIAAPTHAELDLTDAHAVREFVGRLQPALVVNAAGYTDVDGAESDVTRCADLNAHAPAVLADECRRCGSVFLHLSTDYVFDGRARTPYTETDTPAPLNTYGRTKLAGEEGIIAAGGAFLILRTSWVYATRGQNFALTMLRLARERQVLSVVSDQIGAPTWATAVAQGIATMVGAIASRDSWLAAAASHAGIYHMTAAGATTWFDFAKAILAADPAPQEQLCRDIRPISSADYAAPAVRPQYSLLDNSKIAQQFGVRLPPWEDQWCQAAAELGVNAGRASFLEVEARRADRSTT